MIRHPRGWQIGCWFCDAGELPLAAAVLPAWLCWSAPVMVNANACGSAATTKARVVRQRGPKCRGQTNFALLTGRALLAACNRERVIGAQLQHLDST